ncbi:glycerol-3-phosphate cytidylyltransferase [Erysipelotrichaceae bacterium]|nr:glycerol-3-phosphate cytidylyltransferase [Erysipelotrichaceae bacterium]
MKRVITYGTFDLLHSGHIKLLKRAKALGDYLVVAVSSDAFNKLKAKEASIYSLAERIELLEAIRYVDEVIIENSWEQKIEDINRLNIDVFVMGDDWSGYFDFLAEYCDVLYLERTPNISTTFIKCQISEVKSTCVKGEMI